MFGGGVKASEAEFDDVFGFESEPEKVIEDILEIGASVPEISEVVLSEVTELLVCDDGFSQKRFEKVAGYFDERLIMTMEGKLEVHDDSFSGCEITDGFGQSVVEFNFYVWISDGRESDAVRAK